MMIVAMMALLIASVQGQVSPSSTPTPSVPSLSGTNITPSNSVTVPSPSATGATPSNTVPAISPSATGAPLVSPSGTAIPPVAATSLTNLCPRPYGGNHVQYLCPTWVDPSGLATSWTISVNGGPAITVVNPVAFTGLPAQQGDYPQFHIVGPAAPLLGGTTYSFTIIQINSAGLQSVPYTATLTTSASDAHSNTASDLTNVACSIGTSNSTLRSDIVCSWTQPTHVTRRVVVTARCVSPLYTKNRKIKLNLEGAPTSATLLVNRAQTTCHVSIVAHYPYHYANDHRGKIFTKTCLVGTATTCS